jgi:hypothetical protein
MPSGTFVQGLEEGLNDEAADRLVRTHAPNAAKWDAPEVIGGSGPARSAGCLVWDEEAAAWYERAAVEAGGLYLFDFAPHEQYWDRRNDVNRD